ncbi:MAG: DEAD/DEAH box helicase, partial [Candidatus Nitrosotenuis sp.]
MTAFRLDAEVQFLKGVGPRRAEQLARLGITTVKDLLFHFPVRYEDRRNIRSIDSLTEGETHTIRGVIHETNEKRLRFGKSLFQMGIRDATGILRCVWFNVRSDYLKKKYSVGRQVVATGRVHLGKTERSFEMSHPDIVVLDEGEDEATGGILPVYPLTEGINQGTMRKIVAAALDAAPPVPENLPAAMLERLHLPPRHEAVIGIHRPAPGTPPEKLTACRTKPHKRMIFEELFLIECAMAILRSRNTERVRGVAIPATGDQCASVTARLPFELTADQQAVLREILADLRGEHPMNRLVQGDVGCGKTVVAAVTLALAAVNGFQGVLMAPTEILAEQHFSNLTKMNNVFPLRVELLTSGTKKKDGIRARAAAGEIDLLIGTHALIQQSVAFKNLGVAVIDEQHRFGVMQRAELMKKGERPNTLIMTATPIPRTLAMTLY